MKILHHFLQLAVLMAVVVHGAASNKPVIVNGLYATDSVNTYIKDTSAVHSGTLLRSFHHDLHVPRTHNAPLWTDGALQRWYAERRPIKDKSVYISPAAYYAQPVDEQMATDLRIIVLEAVGLRMVCGEVQACQVLLKTGHLVTLYSRDGGTSWKVATRIAAKDGDPLATKEERFAPALPDFIGQLGVGSGIFERAALELGVLGGEKRLHPYKCCSLMCLMKHLGYASNEPWTHSAHPKWTINHPLFFIRHDALPPGTHLPPSSAPNGWRNNYSYGYYREIRYECRRSELAAEFKPEEEENFAILLPGGNPGFTFNVHNYDFLFEPLWSWFRHLEVRGYSGIEEGGVSSAYSPTESPTSWESTSDRARFLYSTLDSLVSLEDFFNEASLERLEDSYAKESNHVQNDKEEKRTEETEDQQRRMLNEYDNLDEEPVYDFCEDERRSWAEFFEPYMRRRRVRLVSAAKYYGKYYFNNTSLAYSPLRHLANLARPLERLLHLCTETHQVTACLAAELAASRLVLHTCAFMLGNANGWLGQRAEPVAALDKIRQEFVARLATRIPIGDAEGAVKSVIQCYQTTWQYIQNALIG